VEETPTAHRRDAETAELKKSAFLSRLDRVSFQCFVGVASVSNKFVSRLDSRGSRLEAGSWKQRHRLDLALKLSIFCHTSLIPHELPACSVEPAPRLGTAHYRAQHGAGVTNCQ
jgi:hypothetical protein